MKITIALYDYIIFFKKNCERIVYVSVYIITCHKLIYETLKKFARFFLIYKFGFNILIRSYTTIYPFHLMNYYLKINYNY